MFANHYLEEVLSFIEQGGEVQWTIAAVTALMWSLILERGFYILFRHPPLRRAVEARWARRSERSSWESQQLRTMWVSEAHTQLCAGIALARTLVAVCPLLGLLGTVVGMIEVFDVMALSGNSNPRALAAGVSEATMTTMSGMVAALSGLFITIQLERYANNEKRKLEGALTVQWGTNGA